ncbi:MULTISPECIES: hypothetical protein [Rhizobium]|uniref:L-seryl-tRNA(Sec) selenium transferase n=1 Tax=Rhizobium favelukesii TaxID=348824 RepID=W6RXU0_9HYPH|nr:MULTISPECIES: hypothetical protein [Rhizobium]MCA0803117.1 hypothetical protein [Rhizobium sp. T1473]MCS0460121.1 hypothetical protein [Rhizobium favelukesii]UFS83346.1 hypothetical protein LPB79_13970 [Rhizobium sp. T136]CDM59081.1 L-seryl-tRNA(Sec) selenium transferase [Rhizobium favelukesii]
MQVGSTSALNILRNTYSTDKLNTLTDSASARLKILQNSAKARESLRENMTTSAEAAKSRAARKLEEAKQQLEMLRSGGYPPEVVARLAAELAHKISAAAAEFASAVATSATSIASAAVATADAGTGAATVATTDAPASTATASSNDTKSGTAQADEPDGATPARNAYQRIVEDGKRASSGISAEDRKTMEEFKSILQEVRQLMDRAVRELRAGRGQSGSGTTSPVEAKVGISAIPTSFTI